MSGRVQNIRYDLCTRKAAESLRAFQGAAHDLKIPVDIESLARFMGFQVILLETVGEEFSGLVSVRQKLIGVNARHHRHRRRFTIGHELAHVLLNHPPESHCSGSEISLYNSEADACAAELLMPAVLIERSPLKTLAGLATAFDVSMEAMAVRLQRVHPSGKRVPLFAGRAVPVMH
jgi:Zn-dependent peptidase ImmA (M78 family)